MEWEWINRCAHVCRSVYRIDGKVLSVKLPRQKQQSSVWVVGGYLRCGGLRGRGSGGWVQMLRGLRGGVGWG